MAKVRIKGASGASGASGAVAGTAAALQDKLGGPVEGAGTAELGSTTIPGATDAPIEGRLTEDLFKGETEKAEFVSFLTNEIRIVASGAERTEWLTRVDKWRRQRQAIPAQAVKDYPFPGSANTSPPLVLTRSHTVYSKLMSNYSTKRPFWSSDAVSSEWALHGEVMADVLNYFSRSRFHLNLQGVNRPMFWDLVTLGTQFVRVSWEAERFKTSKEEGGKPRYRRNSPTFTPVAIEDFFMRTVWTDIQDAPWCGVRMKKSYRELADLAAQGYFDQKAVETMKSASMRQFTDAEVAEFERQGVTPDVNGTVDSTKFFELFECYAYWDVDGDGQLEDILVTIEPTTGTLLRTVGNKVGWRLFGRLVFSEIPNFLYGGGVCFLLEKLQDEADTLRNMRIDAIRWRMLNMTKTKKGSGVDPNATAYPGKNWVLNSMDDFEFIEVPDVSQTTLEAEAIVARDADLASGANEAMGGFADSTLKSGGGAQAQQLMMEQGFSTLNVYLETVDDGYAELGRMASLVLHANQDLVDVSFLSPEKQQAWKEICAQPIEQLPSLFRFNIQTTELARNEASMRDNYMALSGLITQYGTEMTQTYVALVAAQQQGQPFMADVLGKLINGKTKVMEKMIEFLHVGKPSDFLPDLTLLGGTNGQPGQPAGNGGGTETMGAGAPAGGGSLGEGSMAAVQGGGAPVGPAPAGPQGLA